MKIGIQHTPIGFNNLWISYCEENDIPYKLINCYEDNIINQLEDCDAFMWNHDLLTLKDNIIAKRLLFALEHSGKITFPRFEEGWHYDDKIGQKFLLESLKAPMVPTYLFVEKSSALEWIAGTDFPKVFKLKGGAGSSNVKLIKNKKTAIKFVDKAFGKGFKPISKRYFLDESIRKYKENEIGLLSLCKSLIRSILPLNRSFINQRDRGYIYFQEFIPDNSFDIRIVVINQNKAFGIKRYNRKNDFRASGSGKIEHLDESNCPEECLRIAFSTTKKLNMDSIAYDFVFGTNGKPLIVEISFAYGHKASKASGYWDFNLNWHSKKINMQEWMIQNVMKRIMEKKDTSKS